MFFSLAIKRLFQRGSATDIRLFDEWFRRLITRVSIRARWMTANKITGSRLVLLILTILLMATGNVEVMILVANLRVIDGYTDVLDGVWARRFGHSHSYTHRWPKLDRMLIRILGTPAHFGKFFDQASDKASNWPFLAYLLLVVSTHSLLSTDIGIDYALVAWLFVGLVLDGVNLIKRVLRYHEPDLNGDRLSSAFGKIKTWLYSLGGVFIALSHAWKTGLTATNMIGTAALWLLAERLIPMKKVNERWRWYLPLWRAPALLGLAAVATANTWPVGRLVVQMLGEAILATGVLFGIASTIRQLSPAKKPKESAASRLFVEGAPAPNDSLKE